jgi:hypothetical protein
MPTDETPSNENEPKGPEETSHHAAVSPVVRGSRWVDYDTHELLQMLNDLEDERRWSRFREGVWLAILLHLLVLSAVTWIPTYVFKVPPVVDSSSALDQHKDFTYLDSPKWQPKTQTHLPPQKPVVIDKQTLEAIKRETPQPAQPAPQLAQQPAQQASAPSQPIPPTPQSQSAIQAPHPAAVPARPNFAMGSQNPADQLREAMKGAARNRGSGYGNMPSGGGGLAMHPGAGSGGVQVLSDTQGVDFNGWLQRWHRETMRTWDPLIPDEVNPPILKSGMVAVRFKVLPNGRLMDGSLMLEGRSGDVALDRAAWGALTGSNYPPLPREFHGPYLELRAYFLYNMEPRR